MRTLADRILKELRDELAWRVEWLRRELEEESKRLSLVEEALRELKWLKSDRHRRGS